MAIVTEKLKVGAGKKKGLDRGWGRGVIYVEKRRDSFMYFIVDNRILRLSDTFIVL